MKAEAKKMKVIILHEFIPISASGTANWISVPLVGGVHPQPLMHIAYSPYFHKIYKFPLFSPTNLISPIFVQLTVLLN